MNQNIDGQQVDYETFKAEYDSNPELQSLVQNFDSRGITVKTREKEMPTVGTKKTDSVASSAKRAAAKVINR